MTRTVKLVSPAAEYHFHRGQTLVEVDPGSRRFALRRATRLELARFWIRERWHLATRWWRPRAVVGVIDVHGGSITMTDDAQ